MGLEMSRYIESLYDTVNLYHTKYAEWPFTSNFVTLLFLVVLPPGVKESNYMSRVVSFSFSKNFKSSRHAPYAGGPRSALPLHPPADQRESTKVL